MTSNWDDLISLYLTWLAAGGASRGTIKVRRCHLAQLAAAHPDGPSSVTIDGLTAWLSNPGWQPETRKSVRTSLRQFYRWALGRGAVSDNPAIELPRIRIPRTKPRPAPDLVVTHALEVATDRERLMVLLGARGGLRRGEISRVRGTDLLDGDLLRVTGKGGHVRLVPIIEDELIHALEQAGPRYLFPGQEDGHVSAHWVGVLLSRLLGAGWTGHTLRHRCASRAYAGTKDLRAVQELLGHASPVTTAIYTAVVTDDLRAAVAAAA